MKKTRAAVLFVGVCVILFFVVTSGYSYIKNYLADKGAVEMAAQERQKAAEQQAILKVDFVQFQEFTKLPSVENQKKYLAGVEGRMKDQAANQDTRNVLLLRKAFALAEVRGDDLDGEKKREALMLFGNFILSTSTKTQDVYFKDLSAKGFVYLSMQCCGIRPLDGAVGDMYHGMRKPYEDEGYRRDGLGELFTLRDILKKVSLPKQQDRDYAANAFNLDSSIISLAQGGELKTGDYTRVMSDLGKLLESFNTLGILSSTKTVRDTLLPQEEFVRAYDVYNSQNLASVTPEINKKIDENYESFFNDLAQAESEGQDSIGINTMRMFSGMRYLRSMDRRYGNSADQSTFTRVLDLTIKAINSSESLKKAFSVYAKANNGSYIEVNYFVSLSKKNEKVASLLKANGIEPSL